MRSALRTKGLRARQSQTTTLPAPVGGWNARDSLAAMKPTDAVSLINMFPTTSTVDVRGGSIGPRSTARYDDTLMVYQPMSGSNELLTGKFYKVLEYDGSTATPCTVFNNGVISTAPMNGRWIWTMFGDGTNHYLIMVNGVNNPVYYWGVQYGGLPRFEIITGTTSPALSGVTLTDINYVNVYKGRLFFLLNNSLSFGYLSAGAAGGAITTFPLDAEAKRGGRLVAMGTWTRDAGDGQDDVAVFVTSEGEAIVYQGNDPSSAVNWGKVGTFYIGRPLGNRCLLQFGGDLLILTENGIFPLSAALQTAQVSNQYAISFKIEKAFTDVARSYGQNFGWKMQMFPARNALIVNIPLQEGAEHEQYVMNTITKAWTRFTNWHAEDFAVMNGRLYFIQHGASDFGLVYEAWTGGHDAASVSYILQNGGANLRPISWSARQAYTALGASGQRKAVTLLRPLLEVGGHLTYQVGLDVDYQQTENEGTTQYRSTQAVWGEATWGVSTWPVEPEIARDFVTPGEHPGLTVSVKLSGETNDATPATNDSVLTELQVQPTIKWIATDLVYEMAEVL